MYKKPSLPLLLVLVISFLTITNNIYAQDALSTEPGPLSSSGLDFSGVDNYDVSESNIVYNFNDLADNTIWRNIQYPYANFFCYNRYLIISSIVQTYPHIFYTNFIACDYPPNFGAIGVRFNQPIHNLSFYVVGGDSYPYAGTFKVDIHKNNQYSQTLTLPTSCGGRPACFVNLTQHTNVTGVDLYAINDDLGVGFDDFSFALGATPPPPPPPPPTNQPPIGSLDKFRVGSEGTAVGWTHDPDNLNVSNAVQFYVDGVKGSGIFAGQMIANIPRSDVGNHGFEFSIPVRFRDAKPHTLYAYGQDLTSGKPDVLLTGSPRTFNISPSVAKVVFDPITDEVIEQQFTHSEIDRATGFEGQRIFPDAKQPDENVNRKRVRVKATISPAIKDIRVYFRNFDVDDPSSDINIDENDVNGGTGNDNREGRVIDQPYPASAAGTLNAVSALTDTNGVATVYLSVTKQPGDNFVVSASVDETYSNGIAINGTGLKDSTNKSLPTDKAERTELLTVWRKLHMEIDSMGEVQGNFITGFLRTKGETVSQIPKWIDFHPSKVDDHNYQESLETLSDNSVVRLSYGGRMVIAGVNSLHVLDNLPIYLSQEGSPDGQRINGGERIKVQSFNEKVYLRPNHPFKLFDDDDFNSDDGDQKDGDNGENVEPLSDTLSYMQAKDNVAENAYAAAYIKPEYQWAETQGFNNSNVPFVLHSPCTMPDCEEQRPVIEANNGSQSSERDNFWIGYLLVSYQGDDYHDVDPGGYLGGVSPKKSNNAREYEDYYNQSSGVPPGGIGAVIFIEGIRDYALKPLVPTLVLPQITFSRTKLAPHEVGHEFGLAHNDHRDNGGLMSYTGDLYFAPNHVNMMRWRVKSPGEGQ